MHLRLDSLLPNRQVNNSLYEEMPKIRTSTSCTLNISYSPLIRFGQHPYKIKPIWQGFTNGCGTTSLAMVLNALANSKGSGQEYTREKLDYRRPFNMYTSPKSLVRLATEQGFYAAQYNQSSFKEIKKHLDKGHLIIALHNPHPNFGFSALHYAVIYDYLDGPIPSAQKIKIVDPAQMDPDKAFQEVSLTEFSKKWHSLKQGPVPTGIDRFIVVVSNSPDLLADRNIPVSLKMADAVLKAINWYANSYLEPVCKCVCNIAMLPLRALWQLLRFMSHLLRAFKNAFE